MLILLLLCGQDMQAQRGRNDKLSPWLRLLAYQADGERRHAPQNIDRNAPRKGGVNGPEVCAFVRVAGDGDALLREYGCTPLARQGDIYIASIPTGSLRSLSLNGRVERIEARQGSSVQLDSVALQAGIMPSWQGSGLPHPFTGQGVVMGVMDIGFDLTHPNFRQPGTGALRISRLWDFLSADTLGSELYVGRDYTTPEELLALGCCRDGRKQTHGTHTLGIAAGGGHDTRYRGVAHEADICLVANAVSDDVEFVDSADYYKYTFATDALGFQYIMDYAAQQGKPCVISFSEGSAQDFWGYDQLYYEYLDRLTGPGRVIVASAGNYGQRLTYLHKPKGQSSAGCFLRSSDPAMMTTVKSASRDFSIRLVVHSQQGSRRDTLTIAAGRVTASADSILTDTLTLANDRWMAVAVEAFPNCYDSSELCLDLLLSTPDEVGSSASRVSLELLGEEADVEAYRQTGFFTTNALDPKLADAQPVANILSPGSSPGVICVGATMWKQGVTNVGGDWVHPFSGENGRLAPYSSRGPTFDGRVKPDVVAPGTNVVSSNSSFHLEERHDDGMAWAVALSEFEGRTYPWSYNSGTSMSAPVVGGAVALWLQARPDLTPSQVLDVISRTSTRLDPSLDYPNCDYGWGEIDVYRGLLDVLGISAVQAVSAEPTKARISVVRGGSTGRSLQVEFPQPLSEGGTLHLYSLAGKKLFSTQLPANRKTVSITVPTVIADGLYAVQLSGTFPGSAIVSLSF